MFVKKKKNILKKQQTICWSLFVQKSVNTVKMGLQSRVPHASGDTVDQLVSLGGHSHGAVDRLCHHGCGFFEDVGNAVFGAKH